MDIALSWIIGPTLGRLDWGFFLFCPSDVRIGVFWGISGNLDYGSDGDTDDFRLPLTIHNVCVDTCLLDSVEPLSRIYWINIFVAYICGPSILPCTHRSS
jgi:hypothetical protein